MKTFRDLLTSEQRATNMDLVIDPGFVHHRKVQTIIEQKGMDLIDNTIMKLPDLPDWERKVRIDHIYSDFMLYYCKALKLKPLQDAYTHGIHCISCSTEKLTPCPEIYDKERVSSTWIPPFPIDKKVEFHFSTKHVYADTLKSRLHQGNHQFSIIAELTNIESDNITFDPIIMGFPWLRIIDKKPTFDSMWFHYSFYENYLEDFDEFKKINEIPLPANSEPMKEISENAFKTCISKLLGDKAEKDWGGETSDYFSSHLHLNGKPTTGAFLLKGPAKFEPMKLNHLGKNNDQIVRLSHEPTNVLFVQHCHDITTAVRETLRAFAVQPGNPRRYCLIDGRDSLRLLYAYNLYDKALELSKKS
ncbi:MAG: hypothetical protein H8D23_19320 [Candidatus Brocadiales bacterium]|nr:hypothetical protein [Candidatus Brocadiales bacterium]